jgi:disulfide bond formation protein DsbB
MKGIENYNDIVSVLAGLVGAMLKGIKHKLGIKITLVSMIAGAFLCYATVGFIEWYFNNLPPKIVITIAFFVGFVANVITDMADNFVKDMYDIGIEKIRKIKISKNDTKKQ